MKKKKKKKLVKNSRTGFRDVCEKVLISDIHSSYTFRCAQKKKWGENKLRNAPQPHTKICKLDKGGRRAGDMQRGTATISTLGWSVCELCGGIVKHKQKSPRMLCNTTPLIP